MFTPVHDPSSSAAVPGSSPVRGDMFVETDVCTIRQSRRDGMFVEEETNAHILKLR